MVCTRRVLALLTFVGVVSAGLLVQTETASAYQGPAGCPASSTWNAQNDPYARQAIPYEANMWVQGNMTCYYEWVITHAMRGEQYINDGVVYVGGGYRYSAVAAQGYGTTPEIHAAINAELDWTYANVDWAFYGLAVIQVFKRYCGVYGLPGCLRILMTPEPGQELG